MQMKKLLILGILSLSSIQMAQAHSYMGIVQNEDGSLPEVYSMADTSNLTNTGKLSVDVYMRNFTSSDQDKVNKAIIILEKVMNSNEFKQRVLNFKFKGKKQFHNNNGMTNEEIYNHLMTGAENLMPESVGVMNFDLSLYRSKNPWSKVKGYTTADSMQIFINKKFFRLSSWTPLDVAGNMAHEWVHKMGFGHDYRDNIDRPSSVPYAIGYMLIDIAKEMNL